MSTIERNGMYTDLKVGMPEGGGLRKVGGVVSFDVSTGDLEDGESPIPLAEIVSGDEARHTVGLLQEGWRDRVLGEVTGTIRIDDRDVLDAVERLGRRFRLMGLARRLRDGDQSARRELHEMGYPTRRQRKAEARAKRDRKQTATAQETPMMRRGRHDGQRGWFHPGPNRRYRRMGAR